MDNLDKVLQEMVFKDHWRSVAIREGMTRGMIISSSIFSFLILMGFFLYSTGIIELHGEHTACYAAFASNI